jgi:beta-phosphoglucomutase
MIIYEIFGRDRFDVIINEDQFEGKAKPDPVPFKGALQILNVKSSDAIVVENARLEFQQLTAHIFHVLLH